MKYLMLVGDDNEADPGENDEGTLDIETWVSTNRAAGRWVMGDRLRPAEDATTVRRRGGKVLVCGNGGSAADAQHFAAELVGRFLAPGRPGLPVLALTADTAVLTAWANDVGYDDVFARQVQALGRPGDAVIGISTSGPLLHNGRCLKRRIHSPQNTSYLIRVSAVGSVWRLLHTDRATRTRTT